MTSPDMIQVQKEQNPDSVIDTATLPTLTPSNDLFLMESSVKDPVSNGQMGLTGPIPSTSGRYLPIREALTIETNCFNFSILSR